MKKNDMQCPADEFAQTVYPPEQQPEGRYFEGGAYRDTDSGKHDYEGFLNPLPLSAFGEYMTEHRLQSDGTMRDSDNWQAGIPMPQYMKSMLRHVFDVWAIHRGLFVYKERKDGREITHVTAHYHVEPGWRLVDMKEALCAVWFNTQGYLFEWLKENE